MKIIKISGLLIVFVLFSAVGAYQYFVRRALPVESGEVQLKGLQSKVKVIKDKWGIPHIDAASEEDAYLALGYIMASERLFQMDLMRRIASGRLSEILGEKTIKVDTLLRKLRIRQTVDDYFERHGKTLNGKMVNLANQFFKGVQSYIENNPLPIEFVILGYEPEPFSIKDSMGVSGYMALSFAEGLVGDVLFSELSSKFPAKMVDELRVGPKSYFEKKGFAKNSSFLKTQNFMSEILETTEFLEEFFFMFHGSNSWVLSGKRSESGKPILANDPHIAYSNPSVWFEAHINTPTFELYGHYLPLVPFAGLGHNKDHAWALTMSEADDFDMYIEKVNPKNANQVLHKGKWVDLDIEEEIIKIKGREDLKIQVKRSPHGTILNGTDYELKDKTIALSWSYHHPDNHVMEAIFQLNRAITNDEHKKAISLAAAPGLNVSWVNKFGDIGWWVMGKIPKRPKGIASDILLEGWHGKHDYLGYLDFDENPHLVNPESGVIVSTNFKPTLSKYQHIDGYWQPSERYERVDDLLSKKEKWNVEDIKKIQTDVKSLSAQEVLPTMLTEVESLDSELEKKAYNTISKWDYNSTAESVGSALFYVWNTMTMREALIDDLGEKYFKALGRVADYWHFYKVFIMTEDSNWWDDSETDQKETRKYILTQSFKKTVSFLKNKFGSNINEWQWGKLHTLEFEHPLGKVKPLDKIFNIGPFNAPGSFSQVNNISFKRGTLKYDSHLGPSTRRIIDFANPEVSLGIIPTGNSGHIKSDHFDDQAELYIAGNYRKQLMNDSEIKKENYKEFYLIP